MVSSLSIGGFRRQFERGGKRKRKKRPSSVSMLLPSPNPLSKYSVLKGVCAKGGGGGGRKLT